MVHSGCFLERQYCAFTGTVRGQNSREFIARLVARGFARAIEPGPVRRGRLYHVHHKPLYEAIGQPDNRNRRLHTIGRMVERVMILDAVLGDRRCWWLSPEADKRRSSTSTRDNRSAARRTTRTSPSGRAGSGPSAASPTSCPSASRRTDTGRFVFLYLVNRRLPVDFRQFLIRHAELFRFLHTWTVRLLVPRRFRKAVALYKAALREELWTPAEPERHQGAGDVLSASGRHRADTSATRTIATSAQEFRTQGMAKIQALYRAWRRRGRPGAVAGVTRPALRDDRSHGCSAVEVQVLNRQYLQLTGTMDRDVWAKRGAKRKSRQVGPPVSTPSPDVLSPLVAP